MTSDQLTAIAARASADADPMARWDVRQAIADRAALLRYVHELRGTCEALRADAVIPTVRGTSDTRTLPSTGEPLIVRVLAAPAIHRFSDTWSIWRPGEGWLMCKRGRRAWSTRTAAEAVLHAR